jgi:hypothetical protein
MNKSRVVSAEKSEDFLKFDPNNLIVDIEKIVHTKNSNSGMFIPIKHVVPNGTTSFKLQTPEVSGYLADCDPENQGKQYKISLLLDSTNKDPSFLEEDIALQKETVEILEQFKSACTAQLKEKKNEFEKKMTKKINADAWNYMISSFEVVRPYVKTDNSRTYTSYYINPKIINNKNFTTSFIYNRNAISCEKAVQQFLNKKVYCVALFSIDSLFFQASSNKLFVQAKLENLIITRFSNSALEKVSIPARLQNLQINGTCSDEESDLEKKEESFVDTPDS